MGFWRSMKMKRPACMAQPKNGIRPSCFLAIIRTGNGTATNSEKMSDALAWLAMNT